MPTATAAPKPAAKHRTGVGLYGRPRNRCAFPDCITLLQEGKTGLCSGHEDPEPQQDDNVYSIAELMRERSAVSMAA